MVTCTFPPQAARAPTALRLLSKTDRSARMPAPPPHKPDSPLVAMMTRLVMLCGLSVSFFLAWHTGYRQILMEDHVGAPKIWWCEFDVELPDGSESMFVVEVHPEWAPLAAERFDALIKLRFYDETRFHYVHDKAVQLGISPISDVALTWRDHRHIMDEPVRRTNAKRTVSLAPWGANERPNPVEKNMRSTMLSINKKHNKKFDHYKYTPFGKIVKGWDVVYQVYDGYGEEVLPSNMVLKGEEMIDSEFPLLSRVVSARRVEQPPAEPEL